MLARGRGGKGSAVGAERPFLHQGAMVRSMR